MNPARQFLHILRKDIRCHALEIGVVLVLNVVLALALTESWAQSQIMDFRDEVMGSAAQLLLVLACCALIGRVVQGDGVAGKASWWLTRPYARPALLAAKLAFVLLFVHLPIFLGHFAIVTGSGVPLNFAQMLVDQAVLATCLSLPVMTLAAMTSTFSRFVFGCVAVAAVALFVVEGADSRSFVFAIATVPSAVGSQYFLAIMLAIIASIAGAALISQYRWRSTLRVAVPSLVALALVGLALTEAPPLFVMHARAAIARPPTVAPTIRFRDQAEPRVNREVYSNRVDVHLPIEVTDPGEADMYTFKVDVRTAAGRDVELSGAPYGAEMLRSRDGYRWLILWMSPADYDSLKDDLVSVHFIAEVETYEIRETEPIPRDGSVVIVDGRAQCWVPPRFALTCRSSSGWTLAYSGLEHQGLRQVWLPVRLRFPLKPVVTVGISTNFVNEASTPEIPTSVRRHVSHTRQDITFENVRLGDWGP